MPSSEELAQRGLEVAREAIGRLDALTAGCDQIDVAEAASYFSKQQETEPEFVELMAQLAARYLLIAVQHLRGAEVLSEDD
jgi:hypothetical protein